MRMRRAARYADAVRVCYHGLESDPVDGRAFFLRFLRQVVESSGPGTTIYGRRPQYRANVLRAKKLSLRLS